MLEQFESELDVEKDVYQERLPQLCAELRELQQLAREAQLPVLVLFEGPFTAGKGDAIRQMTEPLDPRGFKVSTFYSPNELERRRHWLWRYWVRLPRNGEIAFFERSWYTRVLDDAVQGQVSKEALQRAYQEINETEQMLVEGGCLIVKLFLQISKKRQRKRLEAAETDPYHQFIVTEEEWRQHARYDRYLDAAETMLERTESPLAPWRVIAAGKKRHRRLAVLQTVTIAIQQALVQRRNRQRQVEENLVTVELPPVTKPPILPRTNLSRCLSAEEYDKAKFETQVKLRVLQHAAMKRGLRTVIVYEGWDAAGKGGSIRRLTATLDPRGYSVVPVGKPTELELAHHYLWRFWKELPEDGQLVIFDRSWYGRVLVERVEGFATQDEWRRAYDEINAFERHLTAEKHVLIKFWLHISPEEQLKRFETRQGDIARRHKLTDEDWRNRKKWADYNCAVEEMLQRTSPANAPWTVVEGDCKRYARVKALKTVVGALERALG